MITEREAAVLSQMLNSSARKIARLKDRVPGTDIYAYVWAAPAGVLVDMANGYRDITEHQHWGYLNA